LGASPADVQKLVRDVVAELGRRDFAHNDAGIEGTQANTAGCSDVVWLCSDETSAFSAVPVSPTLSPAHAGERAIQGRTSVMTGRPLAPAKSVVTGVAMPVDGGWVAR
jgi:hypothetical protein